LRLYVTFRNRNEEGSYKDASESQTKQAAQFDVVEVTGKDIADADDNHAIADRFQMTSC